MTTLIPGALYMFDSVCGWGAWIGRHNIVVKNTEFVMYLGEKDGRVSWLYEEKIIYNDVEIVLDCFSCIVRYVP